MGLATQISQMMPSAGDFPNLVAVQVSDGPQTAPDAVGVRLLNDARELHVAVDGAVRRIRGLEVSAGDDV